MQSEVVDSYGLGKRESLQDAVESVIALLGMAACEGSECVPPNARSHAVTVAGTLVGDVQILVRLQFGTDTSKNVAMKMTVRSDSEDTSELVHRCISES